MTIDDGMEFPVPGTGPIYEAMRESFGLFFSDDVCETDPRLRAMHDHAYHMVHAVGSRGFSTDKANRWLGFLQGMMWAMNMASIDDFREINSRILGVDDTDPGAPTKFDPGSVT